MLNKIEKNYILIDNRSHKSYIKDTKEHNSAHMCAQNRKGEPIEPENQRFKRKYPELKRRRC